jgi:hypothetical protein
MKKFVENYLSNRILSRSAILMIDVIIVITPSLCFMENYHENMENYLTHICFLAGK